MIKKEQLSFNSFFMLEILFDFLLFFAFILLLNLFLSEFKRNNIIFPIPSASSGGVLWFVQFFLLFLHIHFLHSILLFGPCLFSLCMCVCVEHQTEIYGMLVIEIKFCKSHKRRPNSFAKPVVMVRRSNVPCAHTPKNHK